MLPEVRYHVDIVRKVTGTERELGIAREVSCSGMRREPLAYFSGRLSHDKGQDTELVLELASGSNGGRSLIHGTTQMQIKLHGCAIAVRSLHLILGGPGGLCVEHDDLRGTLGDPLSDA